MQQRLVEAELTKFRFSLDWLFNGNPKLMMPVKILVSLNDLTDDDRIVGKEESACLQCFPHFYKTHPCPSMSHVPLCFLREGRKVESSRIQYIRYFVDISGLQGGCQCSESVTETNRGKCSWN